MSLVILSGPSGVGKDSVIRAWKATNANVRSITTYTTREARKGESDGEDYHFVETDVFKGLVEDGFFADHREIFGSYYGVAEKDLELASNSHEIVVTDLDVEGVSTIYASYRSALRIFLLPPSLNDLSLRLSEREGELPAERLDRAKREIASADTYDYQVRNSNVKETVERLEEIVIEENSHGNSG